MHAQGHCSIALCGADPVDIPVSQGRGVGGGLFGLRPDPNSAASSAHSPGAADEVLRGVFSHSSPREKVGPPSGSELSADFTSWTPAAYGVPILHRVRGGGPRWVDEFGRTWMNSAARG